ncbi:RsmD family RNA methyltransferase [Paracoccus methylarcula]|uniref:RsmD family RNA methyltransferase n=1 Tax=Paracoccus methylarcula TaxID=72022 RepID=A0A3R7NBH4_9RHOB|nr:RsmD family RNA methyltransferase [Paracoccus methylarcula]RNF34129.1 RsmD family RNA methyltransferase [Paracoccus methylarcula]
MRIVGGAFRGLKLAELGQGDAAAHLRPTTDRVREAVFNLLINGNHGNPVPNACVLDLFAGTGALGLEALSRGADRAVFIDNGSKSLELIRSNAARARVMDRVEIRRGDATGLGKNAGPPCGLVFLDPPYAKRLGEKAVISALEGGWIAPDAMIVWEEALPPEIPAPLVLIDQRKYGDSIVSLAKIQERG